MLDGLARDVDLRDMRVQERNELADGGDLERSANDNHEVGHLAVDINQATRKLVRERLAEKGNVGLHDAALAWHVVFGIVGAVVVAGPTSGLLLGTITHELALAAVLGAAAGAGALGTVGKAAGLDVGEDGLAWCLVVAFDAGCGGKRPVAIRESSVVAQSESDIRGMN